ncbi:MAG: beta-glucosidase [Bacteroidetes bacterium]|nr:beta-glucosidase [Bacteroidota bacterium]
MKTQHFFTLLFVALALKVHVAVAQPGNRPSPETRAPGQEQQIADLLQRMTLEDKVGEMTQLTLDMLCYGDPYKLDEPVRLDPDKMHDALVELRVGSILNAPNHTLPRERWVEIIQAIQAVATEEKLSGIPVLYGIDAIHGANYVAGATLFPQQIALAATWDTSLARRMGQIVAYETRAAGIPWNFSPVLDIGRDPQWPRFWETFGEDVLLASHMGQAMIRGYQGKDLSSGEAVAACMKHFLGYSVTLSGRDRTQAWIPDRELRQYFLPTFQAAIDAGARTIMINSGEINGVPVHVNRDILQTLLREELGFTGVAVSDWEDIKYLYTRHRVARDYKDAIAMAINAGIDMSMVPTDLDFPVLLAELVREGKVPMARIDESVGRILRLKQELGLFEQPRGPAQAYPLFGSPAHAQVSYQAAVEAMTLLRNRNSVLPLSDQSRILVTGPTANSLNALNGGWTHTWQGVDTTYNTPGKRSMLQALRDALPGKVSYTPGSGIDQPGDLNEVARLARDADVIVVCLGEMPYTEVVGNLNDLDLPLAQRDLLRAAKATGKPVVLVLVEGRPRTFNDVADLPDAVLMAYLPGDEGGRAITDVLLGRRSPGGHLPFTYPRYSNALMTYDHKKTDGLDVQFGWTAFDPLFQFGEGMSYTTFAFSNAALSPAAWDGKSPLELQIDVRNTGRRDGSELVAVYLDDEVASITPPVKRLVDYRKVSLAPGQSSTVSFALDLQDLAFIGADGLPRSEAGTFRVLIGDQELRFELLESAKP